MIIEPERLIYLHGLDSNSQGVKAGLLRQHYSGMLIPDFTGPLEQRMDSLFTILGDVSGWTIIGSSFGGLMGALYTCQRPRQVRKLVLLAPALIWPDFANANLEPVSVPTIAYHGIRDELIPIEIVRDLAERTFLNLTFHAVDDDHGLYQTVHTLNWDKVLES